MSDADTKLDVGCCAFCGRRREEVRDLVPGPGGLAICDECVEICNQILAARSASGGPPPPQALGVPFEIADLAKIAGVPCPCGTSRRAFMRPDNSTLSVHLVEIKKDAKAHYHKFQTETYYFLEGEGQMELDGTLYPVKPGMSVMIRPGTRHRAVVGKTPMKILNIVVPPFDEKDEWFD
ncbi:MAG TPA: ClpX C4-type zinc finger protein [Planctomycetota bacterium]|nr:ClpX C4-type zinc finger protein [Planctomycetota bacterium]